jgi:hypothetical protein
VVQTIVWVGFAVICVVACLLVAVRMTGTRGPADGLADVYPMPSSPLPVGPETGTEPPAAMAGPPAPPSAQVAIPLQRMTSLPTRPAPAAPSPSSLGSRSGVRNTASARWSRPVTRNRPTAGGGHAEASALNHR